MSSATNTSTTTFGLCTAGSSTVTHFSVGRATSGTGEILASAALSSSLAVSNNITPSYAAGQLSVTGQLNLLKLLFNNTTWANVGDATGVVGSTVAGSLFIGLHTADPSAGDQTTSEAAYTGYARVAIARSSAGFTVA